METVYSSKKAFVIAETIKTDIRVFLQKQNFLLFVLQFFS